jgi:hypothetical protein
MKKYLIVFMAISGLCAGQISNWYSKTVEELSGITAGVTNIASKTYWETHAYQQIYDIIQAYGVVSQMNASDNDPDSVVVVDALGNVKIGYYHTMRSLLYTGDSLAVTYAGASDYPLILFENTNAGAYAPTLRFYKNSASPADGENVGTIYFTGNDSAGNATHYAYITGYSEDMTSNDEAGKLQFNLIMDAVDKNMFMIDAYTGTKAEGIFVFNEDGMDMDYRIESDNDANAFFIEGSTGDAAFGSAAPIGQLYVVGDTLHVYSATASQPTVLIHNANADANPPLLEFKKLSASPADDDVLGRTDYKGYDSGSTLTTFAQVYAQSADVTDTDEAGALIFKAMIDGSLSNTLWIDGAKGGNVGQAELVINEDSKDMDVRVESDNDANAFFVEGSTGNIGFGTNAPERDIHLKSGSGELQFEVLSSVPVIRGDGETDATKFIIRPDTIEMRTALIPYWITKTTNATNGPIWYMLRETGMNDDEYLFRWQMGDSLINNKYFDLEVRSQRIASGSETGALDLSLFKNGTPQRVLSVGDPDRPEGGGTAVSAIQFNQDQVDWDFYIYYDSGTALKIDGGTGAWSSDMTHTVILGAADFNTTGATFVPASAEVYPTAVNDVIYCPLNIPYEVFGASVVIDQIYVYLQTDANGDDVDFSLVSTDVDGTITTHVTKENIGNGVNGNLSTTLLTEDHTVTAFGYYMAFDVNNTDANTDVSIFQIKIEYHIEG